MILKMAGSLPQYIYAYDDKGIYINLFVGSQAEIPFHGSELYVRQTTGYPWRGVTKIELRTGHPAAFAVNIRIPGWAQGVENPFGLYHSNLHGSVLLKVNGKKIDLHTVRGYASIRRTWKKGDVIELELPVGPRLISPGDSVETIKGKMAIAAGPIIYGLEGVDNPGLEHFQIGSDVPLALSYKPGLLNGVNVITGKVKDGTGGEASFTAIPFYALGNRKPGAAYEVWVPERGR